MSAAVLIQQQARKCFNLGNLNRLNAIINQNLLKHQQQHYQQNKHLTYATINQQKESLFFNKSLFEKSKVNG